MLWIGITGDIGSGKSTVSDILRQKGHAVLNADGIVHELYQLDKSLVQDIKKRFGKEVISENTVDRKALFETIKKDKNKKQELEALVHPKVKDYVREWKNKNQSKSLVFYEVPLLFEKKLEKEFDKVLYVDVDRSISLQRLKNRNQWTENEIEERRAWLADPEVKRKKADYIIENNGDKKELIKKVEDFLSLLPRIS